MRIERVEQPSAKILGCFKERGVILGVIQSIILEGIVRDIMSTGAQ
jgi:hypothetical protein